MLYTAGGDKAVNKERVELFGASRVGVIEDFHRVELSGTADGPSRSRGARQGSPPGIAAFLDAIRAGGPPIPAADCSRLLRDVGSPWNRSGPAYRST